MAFKLREICYPPDVITLAIPVDIFILHFSTADFFARSYRLDDGDTGGAATSHVVGFAAARFQTKMIECLHEIIGMYVVPDLFALVTVDGIFFTGDTAPHQI